MMTYLDLLSKHVMRGGVKLENVVGTSSGQFPVNAKFEALYNEKFQ
ncbi:hypothetical protein MTR67_022666 [Solanum verrucosum]|uniref:Uncharacterized protein n=1 Tax=Solanum verrucosum TaxID=315347 RepID=A0AAF0QTS6_SOLVR|nr:hypothetical protein MTR67_022666 [Solanum verrucosum]